MDANNINKDLLLDDFTHKLENFKHKLDNISNKIKKDKYKPNVTICYTAIFKNESKNVYRCLNALLNIIDFVSICDTGSTDNTVDLIYQWGKEHNIPVVVHSGDIHLFKNFGYNRSLSFNMAVQSFPHADYALVLDADMVLKIEDNWKIDKNTLSSPCYLLKQKNCSIEYWNTRLLSMKYNWICYGVTHEYWGCDNVLIKDKLYSLWIDDIGDGGCKDNKIERDIKLLTDGIHDPNENTDLKTRYKYYLAQTYNDAGQYKNAISMYNNRILDGGWNEEVYMSKYKIGKCYKSLNKYDKSIYHFLDAWNFRPSRSEPLYEICKIYRELGNHQLVIFFALYGVNIAYPVNDILFIDHNVYKYKFHFEISISAWYIKNFDLGKKSIEYLLSLSDIPKDIYDLTLKNAKFYNLDISK